MKARCLQYVKEISDIMENLTPETQQYLLLMAQELLNVQEKLLNRADDSDVQSSYGVQICTGRNS
jgi:hypothetical protein